MPRFVCADRLALNTLKSASEGLLSILPTLGNPAVCYPLPAPLGVTSMQTRKQADKNQLQFQSTVSPGVRTFFPFTPFEDKDLLS